MDARKSVRSAPCGANVMNLVLFTPGVTDPDSDPDDDESDTNSSTSSFGSFTPRRSSGMTSGERMEAVPLVIGDFVSSDGPAVGDCNAESVSCRALVLLLLKTFSWNWLSGVGATSSIYCCRSDQHRASSVRPAIRATCPSALPAPSSGPAHSTIPSA